MSPAQVCAPSTPPSALATAEIPCEEIHQRLELGRLEVQRTAEGSRLALAQDVPGAERRHAPGALPPQGDRRRAPLSIPTLFPEKGPILLLLVGGFAGDHALRQPLPFWEDDEGNAWLLWQALAAAGFLHRKDSGQLALGRGGFWDEEPPRTQALAMTYVGYRRPGEPVDFDRFIGPWNLRRLHTLVEACRERSMDRLKIITLGEAARTLMCAAVYGLPGVPVLSIPEPTRDCLGQGGGAGEKAAHWIEWTADLLAVGRDGNH